MPPEIGQLINLQEFYCHYNQISSLSAELGNLIRLRAFCFFDNPLTNIPPNVQRLINRIDNIQDVYHDTQSVHNHEIQQSIRKSILNILNDPKPSPVDSITEILGFI